MSRKRTDLAAPTVIDPAAFVLVAGVYFGSASEDFDAVLGDWALEMGLNEDGKYGWYSKRPAVLAQFPPLSPQGNFVRKGTCDHCGARFDWGSVYRHTTGLHIVVGNVCADKTMAVPDRLTLDAKRLKDRIKARKAAAEARTTALYQAETCGYAWLYSEEHTNSTLTDIAAKGLHYGHLTFGQVELIKRIRSGEKPQWMVEREAREAIEATAEPVPCVEGRVTVRGEVLTIKMQDGYMGRSVEKMLVRCEAGYKLWGTVPGTLVVKQGDKVEFQAAIERSEKDDKFGFFARPTKARVVTAVQS